MAQPQQPSPTPSGQQPTPQAPATAQQPPAGGPGAAQQRWEPQQMNHYNIRLNAYVLDYLNKRGFPQTARIFRQEANIQPNPSLVDAPGGFLFEWWTVFWEVFSARNKKSSNPDAKYYVELQRAKTVQARQGNYPTSYMPQPGAGYPTNAQPAGVAMGQPGQVPSGMLPGQTAAAAHYYRTASAVAAAQNPNMFATPADKQQMRPDLAGYQQQVQGVGGMPISLNGMVAPGQGQGTVRYAPGQMPGMQMSSQPPMSPHQVPLSPHPHSPAQVPLGPQLRPGIYAQQGQPVPNYMPGAGGVPGAGFPAGWHNSPQNLAALQAQAEANGKNRQQVKQEPKKQTAKKTKDGRKSQDDSNPNTPSGQPMPPSPNQNPQAPQGQPPILPGMIVNPNAGLLPPGYGHDTSSSSVANPAYFTPGGQSGNPSAAGGVPGIHAYAQRPNNWQPQYKTGYPGGAYPVGVAPGHPGLNGMPGQQYMPNQGSPPESSQSLQDKLIAQKLLPSESLPLGATPQQIIAVQNSGAGGAPQPMITTPSGRRISATQSILMKLNNHAGASHKPDMGLPSDLTKFGQNIPGSIYTQQQQQMAAAAAVAEQQRQQKRKSAPANATVDSYAAAQKTRPSPSHQGQWDYSQQQADVSKLTNPASATSAPPTENIDSLLSSNTTPPPAAADDGQGNDFGADFMTYEDQKSGEQVNDFLNIM